MALWEEFQEICTMKNKTTVADGQGGFITTWENGAEFMAAVVKSNSIEARIAEKQGVTEVYTVTTNTTAQLEYHDVFMRNSDGKLFRVTSNFRDTQPPKSSSFKFYQVTAEAWEIQ